MKIVILLGVAILATLALADQRKKAKVRSLVKILNFEQKTKFESQKLMTFFPVKKKYFFIRR